LEGESVTLIQAARLVLEIKEALGDEICTINRCREVVSLGLNAIKNKHHTVSFGTAAVECLRSKSHRRPRTLTDIRSIIQKLKKSNPELEQTPLRNISVEDCQSILMNTFTTSRQRHKARLILSGIFSFSVKRGWCDENPILRVDTPFLKEQEIPALTLKEVTLLLKTCMDEFNGSCVAGAALMIFAGIRPQEVERLLWENIAIRDGCIILNSKHTKTGGARHVTILPVLAKWLTSAVTGPNPDPELPSARKGGQSSGAKSEKAGWGGRKIMVPDCLRHTYASYHAKHFKDYNLLQMEMGHRSSSLLRTRYLNMKGISPQTATRFWA
ncbi:MAG: tyrosine-type recombinase/integrase, partial [Akkermansia sp.]